MEDILVVEDDPNLADILQRSLAAEGLSARVASTGDQAIRMFQEKRPDLLVMDLMLPDMDGWTAIQEMRGRGGRSRPPVLVLTAVEKRMDDYTLRDWGATDYLEKPFSPHELVARVRRLLGGEPPPSRAVRKRRS